MRPLEALQQLLDGQLADELFGSGRKQRSNLRRPGSPLLVAADQKTVVQSFLMLTTVQPLASACLSACSAPAV
jgi:hypothetical protein